MSSNSKLSDGRLWIGRILFWLVSAFLVMDIGMHIARPPFVVEASAKAGIDATILLPIGLFELVALGLLLAPRFRVLGGLFFTAFLGGATASHILISHTLPVFPIATGVLLWFAIVCLSPKSSESLGLEIPN